MSCTYSMAETNYVIEKKVLSYLKPFLLHIESVAFQFYLRQQYSKELYRDLAENNNFVSYLTYQKQKLINGVRIKMPF